MKVAVMGYGTVGSGVVEVIESHSDIIPKKQAEKSLKFQKFLIFVISPVMLIRRCSPRILTILSTILK